MKLSEDVKVFALNTLDERIEVSTTSLRFAHVAEHEDLPQGSRVVGQPVIFRDRAVALGFQDGRVRLFDLEGSHAHRELRVGEAGHAVTALASFGPYLAAGTSQGTVALYEVMPS
ncbi:MAG: hypothetical protein SX243_08205 [Acidobacteriota bacterium]|nr:hypothetical protein [Acidobacteriota bacterium]